MMLAFNPETFPTGAMPWAGRAFFGAEQNAEIIPGMFNILTSFFPDKV